MIRSIKPPGNIIERGTDGNPRCYQMDLLMAVWDEFLVNNNIDGSQLTGYGDNPDHECEWIFNKENPEDIKLLDRLLSVESDRVKKLGLINYKE